MSKNTSRFLGKAIINKYTYKKSRYLLLYFDRTNRFRENRKYVIIHPAQINQKKMFLVKKINFFGNKKLYPHFE